MAGIPLTDQVVRRVEVFASDVEFVVPDDVLRRLKAIAGTVDARFRDVNPKQVQVGQLSYQRPANCRCWTAAVDG
jgi:hypothetical protein